MSGNKRSHEKGNLGSSEAKKMNFDVWKKTDEMPMTPPSTPDSKYSFDIWKSETNNNANPIKMSELEAGICLNRPFRFRVSFKSMRKSSKNGDMFNFHTTDDGFEEMSVTVFPQQISFFDVIEFNHTYELINFNVKLEGKDFPVFVGNGKYISLLSSSKINVIENECIPELNFNFTDIKNVKNLEVSSKCDIFGIIARNWSMEKVGNNKKKRDLSITDKSKASIIVTLWGDSYDKFDFVRIPIILHNGIMKEYNGERSITCSTNSLFWPNPEIKIAEELKAWFDDEILKV